MRHSLLGYARILTAELACAIHTDDMIGRPDRLVYDLAHELHMIAYYGAIMPRLRRYFNENKAV